MGSCKAALRATAPIALGVTVLTGLMLLIYALLGFFRLPVLWGAIAGTGLALLNFFLMALSAGTAADKAQNQDVKGGQAVMQLSYLFRLVLLFALLVVCVKLFGFDPLASVLPVVFVRPVITVYELFLKKGEKTQ